MLERAQGTGSAIPRGTGPLCCKLALKMLKPPWFRGVLAGVLLIGSSSAALANGSSGKSAVRAAKPVKAATKLAPALPRVSRAMPAARLALPSTLALVPAVLSQEQLRIADQVLLGNMQCELGVRVSLRVHKVVAGYFWLDVGPIRHLMEPVATVTGAVRLEAPGSGAVWIQLAHKSMLMNKRLGRRMADECRNAGQWTVAQALLRSPGVGLLDDPITDWAVGRVDFSAY